MENKRQQLIKHILDLAALVTRKRHTLVLLIPSRNLTHISLLVVKLKIKVMICKIAKA